MNILLDTHIAIWAILNDRHLTNEAAELIKNPDNEIYYSAVSVMEVDMKTKSCHNNLDFSVDDFVDMCRKTGFTPLSLKDSHITEANRLVWSGLGDEHKDPFDRILLAQAIVERFYFMTADKKIPDFKQNCIIVV